MSGRQRVLFSGMDCLPGQLDLFATDGEGPVDRAEDGVQYEVLVSEVLDSDRDLFSEKLK